ncbi:hypothetical protein PM082_019798 [Marasmius tenuissimus]|nr:hypothetical protein PM082_019677 [Marasmius tenuissimus]KAJ8075460.1 hypothetical protein PM082_019798 [Marasmius tenuissimus]
MSALNITFPDEYSPLLQVRQVVEYPIVTVLVMCIIYGFHILLFGLCVYVLRRGTIRRRNLYMAWTSILFMLATSSVIVETMLVLRSSSVRYLSVKNHDYQGVYEQSIGQERHGLFLYTLTRILYILANIVADSMLIYRCYVVWGSKKRVVIPLATVSVAISVVSTTGTVMSFMGYRDSAIEVNQAMAAKGEIIAGTSLAISAFFNLALTLLAAGRIWWITRTVNRSKTHTARTINKIILKSGMLYPLVMIIHLAVANSDPDPPLDTFPLLVLAAGITPPLIIVLTHLAIHVVEDLDATYSRRNNLTSFRMTERSFGLSQGLKEPRALRGQDGTEPEALDGSGTSDRVV